MSRSGGRITLTCDRCKKSTVEVKVTALVRGPDSVLISSLTIYPPPESHGWTFVEGEGDICTDCLTPKQRSALERDGYL